MPIHLDAGRRATAGRRAAALVLLTGIGLAATPATAGAAPVTAAGAAAGGQGSDAVDLAPTAPAPDLLGPSATATQEAAVAEAEAQLAALAEQASAALETYQNAIRTRDEALRVHQEQAERWERAQADLAESHGEMARWTSQAYRHGAAASGVAGLVAVVDARSPDDLEQRISVLRQVGRAEARSLAGAAEAEAGQEDATLAAEETARVALQGAADAQAAKAASDAAVEAQRVQLAAVRGLLDEAEQAAAADAAEREVLASSRALARPGLAGCVDDDLTGFANGQVPAENLCPLPGGGGQSLRSDAAAAFVELDAAYTVTHGEALCITDSYRDLASQVVLRAAKPTLAAVPGTSNHGWGVAVDLCGAPARFGTAEHQWLRVNAPLHGWFHPAWAAQGGSKPEPWHWEFAG